jgi:hypothetical protein
MFLSELFRDLSIDAIIAEKCCSLAALKQSIAIAYTEFLFLLQENKKIRFEENYEYPNGTNSVSIHFKDFDYMISHHDMLEYNKSNVIEIIKKYERRYERLMDSIILENLIIFVRFVKEKEDLLEEDLINFYNNIENINPNLTFYFIILINENIIFNINICTKKNIIIYNFKSFLEQNKIYDDNIYFRIINEYKYENIYNLINRLNI